jgi:DivIVA domain-containing protein
VITVVQYLVIAAVIGAVMFGIAVFVFGRGEQMAPLPARVSPVELPAGDLHGDHVRGVRFGLALRGYRMSDVDWTLERLADEIDVLRNRLDAVTGDFAPGSDAAQAGAPAGAGSLSTGSPATGDAAAGSASTDFTVTGDAAADSADPSVTDFPSTGSPSTGSPATGDSDQASRR